MMKGGIALGLCLLACWLGGPVHAAIHGGVAPGTAVVIINSITGPSSFVANAGNANATVGALSAVVSSGSFGGTYSLTAVGTGCADSGSFAITGATLKIGAADVTAARAYNICVIGTDAAFSNSPFTQALVVTGTSAATITAVSLTPSTFTAGSGSANSTVGTLAATVSSGSFSGGTFALATSGSCTGPDNSKFVLAGTSLKVGATDVAAGNFTLCVQATNASFSNSPFYQSVAVTGTAVVAPTITGVSLTPSTFTAQAGDANSTVGTLAASVSTGSFGAGTFALATSGSCTGPDNSKFTLTGATIKIGAADLAAGPFTLCVQATNASFSNSPFYGVITVTGVAPGGVIATATYTNYSGATLPAGSPIAFAQAFRYGDIMPGNHPVIRDASTHTPLAGQQWDEIATWCVPTVSGCTTDASHNGSWKHAAWGAWLATAVANGASFQVEYVVATGAYSETSHQALSALCSGAGAHDLKIHITDVRNQNDSTRDSGDATFRVCDNIANSGRDAPRHLRAGNVYDEYEVRGLFVYASSGNKDPLLYVQCPIDIFTKASDGVSPGDVRWVCHIHNSWENVAAGTTGNAGNPGPAGFTGDPQAISYRPEIDDGASNILNWSGLDAVISSSANPIQVGSSVSCSASGPNFSGTWCMAVPSSTGTNTWYEGQATRVTCSGACVAGLTNGQLYYVYPGGTVNSGGVTTTQVALMNAPFDYGNSTTYYPMTGSQGTGTTTFSTRVQDYHWEAWQTVDASCQANWSPVGTTTRVTRKVYPNFTNAEKLYWEQSGVIIPLNLSQPLSAFTTPSWTNAGSQYCNPFGRLNVIGGAQGGPRADIGISNEWAAAAWLNQTQSTWDMEREFSHGQSIHGATVLLNEASGLIPVLNNGPPVGPGGNGAGGSYPGLGAPQTTVPPELQPYPVWFYGLADTPRNQPNAAIDISNGTTGGTGLDHVPNFSGFTYAVFGERQFLDTMYWRANGGFLWQRYGPGAELGQGYTRDNNAVFPGDGVTYHYYGLLIDNNQGRGSAWLMRDIVHGAAFGRDSNIERAYFNDFLVENRHYWPLWLNFRDGAGNTNYTTSAAPPNVPGDALQETELFIENYVASVAWIMVAWLHEPLGSTWMTRYQRLYEGVLGGQLPNPPVSYYFMSYLFNTVIHDGNGHSSPSGGNIGQYTNGVDGADFSVMEPEHYTILTGGKIQAVPSVSSLYGASVVMTVGDGFKNFSTWNSGSTIDQLAGTRFYSIMGPLDQSAGTFYLQCNAADHSAFPTQCPTAGAAFNGFTRAGVPVTNETSVDAGAVWRFQSDPGACQGYSAPNYSQYGGMVINALILGGYNATHALADWNARCGDSSYNPQLSSVNWDRTIVIPGLPAAVNSVP